MTPVVSVFFAVVMVALSFRANLRFRHERSLPMQWSLSGPSLAASVNWSAPRPLALSLTPCLAIVVLGLFNVAAITLTPRPGQEAMELPALLFIGSLFVAIHLLHLWMIGRTLANRGR